ncbi:hypothetical protein ACLMJK_005216 [Lecanora helva]
MASIFTPVLRAEDCDKLVGYMLAATAKFEDKQFRNTFGSALAAKQYNASAPSVNNDLPVVIFSPGLGTSRLLYDAIAQSVASYGYTVITIDHPYDVDVVELPNGTLSYAVSISTPAQVDLDVATRAEDTSFLLNQFSYSKTAESLLPGRAFNNTYSDFSKVLAARFFNARVTININYQQAILKYNFVYISFRTLIS